MSKTKLLFEGADGSNTETRNLTAYCIRGEQILGFYNFAYLQIEIKSLEDSDTYASIYLDRQTAIALVRQLKREIGKMEVSNG